MRLVALTLAAIAVAGCGRDQETPARAPVPVFKLDEEKPAEPPRPLHHVIALVLPDSAAPLKSRADTTLAAEGIHGVLWTRDLGSSSLIVEAADGERARELFRSLDDFRAYVPK